MFGTACKQQPVVSRWWKKCPLRLSHPEQTLLSGERALYLFASDGFAKVQWYSALLWGAQPEGGVPRAVEQQYESFCANVRAVTTVPHLLPAVCVPVDPGPSRVQ